MQQVINLELMQFHELGCIQFISFTSYYFFSLKIIDHSDDNLLHSFKNPYCFGATEMHL